MFNTRNKSGIAAHPCIILYIINIHSVDRDAMVGAIVGRNELLGEG
jgi:hypothetical protein